MPFATVSKTTRKAASGPVGQRQSTGEGAPSLAGVVEAIGQGNHPFKLLTVDSPAPGAVILNVCPMGAQAFVSVAFYFYGDQAEAAVAKNQPLWTKWMKEHFGAPGDASNVA